MDDNQQPPTGARARIKNQVDGGNVTAMPPATIQRPNMMFFDPEELNEKYAVVMVGSKTMILEENFNDFEDQDDRVPAQDRLRFMAFDALEKWMANDLLYDKDKDKEVAKSRVWLASPRRRQFRGVVFEPEGAPGGYYNLWRGWAVEPSENGSCKKFKDHMMTNLCNNDQDLFNRVFGWAAHIFQRPTERLGVALAIRGGKGTGKTFFGEAIGYLMGSHHLLVDDSRYVTGNFNAHMASLLLLQADEGFWAGDVAAEGRLKGLVTSKTQMIEAKGVDAISVKNYLRLMVTSNEDWVVPASYDERRFMVIDCADYAKQNRQYFKEIDDELKNGGYERLLFELLNFDLSLAHLGDIPQTDALVEQKLRTLKPERQWWYECLHRGWITHGKWQDIIDKNNVHKNYKSFCDDLGVKHRRSMSELVRGTLKPLVPGISEKRKTVDDGVRVRSFVFPNLDACRDAFDEWIGGRVPWSDLPEIYETKEEFDDDPI